MVHITRTALKISFTAVFAELWLIAAAVRRVPESIPEMRFFHAVPEMLRLLWLAVCVITLFGAASAYIACGEGEK